MDWYGTVFELIDMRSFSNLWYWIALAVVWSTTSHWVLGVPYDMVLRARREGGEAEEQLNALVAINCHRMDYIARVSGLWILASGCAMLSALAVLGFWYWIEFAQALFLLVFPLTIVGLMSVAASRRILEGKMTGLPLWRKMRLHRLYTQIIGMVAIFVTAVWGMYQNLSVGALGG